MVEKIAVANAHHMQIHPARHRCIQESPHPPSQKMLKKS